MRNWNIEPLKDPALNEASSAACITQFTVLCARDPTALALIQAYLYRYDQWNVDVMKGTMEAIVFRPLSDELKTAFDDIIASSGRSDTSVPVTTAIHIANVIHANVMKTDLIKYLSTTLESMIRAREDAKLRTTFAMITPPPCSERTSLTTLLSEWF
jgi:hypothetical protein